MAKYATVLSQLLFGASLAMDVSAAPREFAYSMLDQDGTMLRASSPEGVAAVSVLQESEKILLAEFSLHDALPAGTQVEIWPQVEGDVAPWDLDPAEFPYGRDLWITDDRTETLLRFDVTAVARAWQAGELPNMGFVLRVIDQPEVEGQSAVQASGAGFQSPKGAILILYTVAARSLTGNPQHEQQDQRETPDAEDGSVRDE